MDPVAVNLLDPKSLVSTFGEAGVMAVLFAETGLLIGFFLPGDSLLFIAGAAAAGAINGVDLNLGFLLPAAVVGAIIGAQVGFEIGRRVGHDLFVRPNSRLFKRKYVDRAEYYFNRFGPGKAVVIARFVPIVRTVLNPLAGVLEMRRRDFLLWNVIGGTFWVVAVVLLGYHVGDNAFVKKHIEVLILAVVAISLVPILVEAARQRRAPADPPRTDVSTSERETSPRE